MPRHSDTLQPMFGFVLFHVCGVSVPHTVIHVPQFAPLHNSPEDGCSHGMGSATRPSTSCETPSSPSDMRAGFRWQLLQHQH